MKKLSLLISFFIFINCSDAQPDLSLLISPPNSMEINEIKEYWDSLNHTPQDWNIEASGVLNGFSVDVISHSLDGNTHYGAVRFPLNYSPTSLYPVLIVNHGGANGVNLGILNVYSQGCYADYFVVIPSFRSEVLNTGPLGLGIFTSTGAPSEMDGDTDDALALLHGVLEIQGADPSRVGAFGGSRGGGVSHLMSVKDDVITATCTYYAATDHLALEGLYDILDCYYDANCNTPLNPPINNTINYAADPYLNELISLEEARKILLRRSAIYFVDQMPDAYQVHHGDADPVVFVEHSRYLDTAFMENGLELDYIEYPGANHSSLPGANELKDEFFCKLLNGSFVSNQNIPLDKKDITIFPNPSHDEITIKFDDTFTGSVAIKNLQGEILLQKYYVGTDLSKIDIQQMTAGMYICEIHGNEQSSVQRLIKL